MPSQITTTRRALLAAGAALAVSLLAAAPGPALAGPRDDDPEPIIFVHGNGDQATSWMVTMWRWESNGYPRDRLFAANLAFPSAPFMEDLPQKGTSGTADQEKALADYVADVLKRTGAKKVAFVANSRGANTIRNFVKNGGGAKVTSHVVLGGGVNHGAFNWGTLIDSAEFNGGGKFMTQLNSGPNEVVPGVDFLTMRSDKLDKYAQPDGRFLINDPKVPTFIDFTAPSLKGAKNIVFPGLDHRESAMSPKAFAASYRFITGEAPKRNRVVEEARPQLSGVVTGLTAGVYDNLPVKGADLRIYKVKANTGERVGIPLYRTVTGKDGRWGPFVADSGSVYEFVLKVDGR